jgi:lipoate-protein ligase A
MIPIITRPTLVRSFNVASLRPPRYLSSWHSELSKPSNQFQIYTSRSNNPYINLSIEHHLFQKSPPGSKILFQYINRPCIVIGRNQNPWLEVNLALLYSKSPNGVVPPSRLGLEDVDLVRRRSGGGTVFHDEGNVNWSVICDFTEFTRDKHAEMVVRALRSIGIDRARVNERHDIVLDQGSKGIPSDPADTHKTAYTSAKLRPLKVSGSAYKMARNRALHHGTALLGSPNLKVIPEYLHSPAKGYINAKGVESVSSPVSNIGLKNEKFMDAARKHFVKMYRVPEYVQEMVVDEDALDIAEINKGYDEITSLEWTYLQTPQFTFSSEPLNEVVKAPMDKPKLTLNAKHGSILSCQWFQRGEAVADAVISDELQQALSGRKIHEIKDWSSLFQEHVPFAQAQDMTASLKRMLPPPR